MMWELAIRVFVYVGVATWMWGVSNSLRRIADDLRVIADRAGAKPPAEDPERLVDA